MSEHLCSLNEGVVTKRTKKRVYKLTARADSQAETRQRIVEAAIQLHERLGPANTPVSAIAQYAGVQRLTVYRHFPDDKALFAACTAHWGARNPPPAAASWEKIKDPTDRAAAAFAAFMDYYAGTHGMWTVAYRDAPRVPAIRPVLAHFDAHLDGLADTLAAGFAAKGARRRALTVTLRHALAFSTWSELERSGFDTAAKVALLRDWLDGVRKSRA
jgi:AcrR family transcriptional regulator